MSTQMRVTSTALRRTTLAAGLAAAAAMAGTTHAAAPLTFRAADGSAWRALVPSQAMARAVRPAAGSVVAPAQAASLAVSGCGDDSNDSTTLRHAIISANSGDKIDLSGLNCGTIVLSGGAIPVTVDDLTIQGPGQTRLVIDGNLSDRVFVHSGAGTLTLKDLTVTRGKLVAQPAYGGCVYSKHKVALDHAAVTSCVASSPTKAAGGGIVALYGLTLESSTLANNLAEVTVGASKDFVAYAGGAFTDSVLELKHSVVSGNTAHAVLGKSYAGGVLAAQVTAKYSTISGNTASAIGDSYNYGLCGGAAAIYAASIVNSTIDNNQADIVGAMVIADSDATSVILQSTISSNKGHLVMGGVLSSAPLSIANSTIAFNTGGPFGGAGVFPSGGSLQMTSTIVSNNSPLDLAGSITVTGSNNLVKTADINLTLPNDTIKLDPKLGPLAANGGTTRTHALGAGSAAIDAGSLPLSLDSDQRHGSYARTVGVAADVGAFEVDTDHIFGDGLDF